MEKSGNDSQDDGKKVDKNRVDNDDINQPSTSYATFREVTTGMAGRNRSNRKQNDAKMSSGDDGDDEDSDIRDDEDSDDGDDEDSDDEPAIKIRNNDGRRFYLSTSSPKEVVPMKPRRTPRFFAVNQIMQRQIGLSNNLHEKFSASVRTVKRLYLLKTFLLSPKPSNHTRLIYMHNERGYCSTIDFNKTGDLLVSCTANLDVRVWNWAKGTEYDTYETGHKKYIFQASWLPHDESSIVTCAMDGQVRLVDTVVRTSRRLAIHDGPCNQFAVHPEDPHVVISAGDDGVIYSTDVRAENPILLATMGNGRFAYQMYTIRSNPRNSNHFCVAGFPSTISIFDRRGLRQPLFQCVPAELRNVTVSVNAVTYNHDGTEILASYDADDIYLFDAVKLHPTGNYAHQYCGRQNRSRNIRDVNYFGPKSEFIVSGSDPRNILFWEKHSENVVRRLRGVDSGMVNFVKPHPSIPVLASSGLTNDVKIWIPGVNKKVPNPSDYDTEVVMAYSPYQRRPRRDFSYLFALPDRFPINRLENN